MTAFATIRAIRHTVISPRHDKTAGHGEAAMTAPPKSSRKETILAGLFALAMGVFIMLVATGILPAKGSAHAPAWIGVLAGLAFALAGFVIVVRAAAGGDPNEDLPADAPWWMRFIQYGFGLGVIGALAAIGTWVAFGPGHRAFSISIPFLGSGPANEWIGRGVFGFGAVLVWLFFILAAAKWGPRLLGRAKVRAP